MAPNLFRRGASTAASGPPPPSEVIEAFKSFVDADTLPECLSHHAKMLNGLNMSPGRFHDFYPRFKAAMKEHVPYKYKEIFKIFTEKAKGKSYMGMPAENQRVLVAGAGPCGLRTAVEAQLLGAKVNWSLDITLHIPTVLIKEYSTKLGRCY